METDAAGAPAGAAADTAATAAGADAAGMGEDSEDELPFDDGRAERGSTARMVGLVLPPTIYLCPTKIS